jgi:hypothetical protein
MHASQQDAEANVAFGSNCDLGDVRRQVRFSKRKARRIARVTPIIVTRGRGRLVSVGHLLPPRGMPILLTY